MIPSCAIEWMKALEDLPLDGFDNMSAPPRSSATLPRRRNARATAGRRCRPARRMDAYGPTVHIGGGAWCGKDLHKPDRAVGMLARRMALECVHLGLGTRIRVQLEYRPNSPAPESVQVWADGREVELPRSVKAPSTRNVAQEAMRSLEQQNFTPLMRGHFARWGHFGGDEWWEAPRAAA